MKKVVQKFYQILKPEKIYAILISDIRKHKLYISIASRIIQAFFEVGFILKGDIIKLQWNIKTTRKKYIESV